MALIDEVPFVLLWQHAHSLSIRGRREQEIALIDVICASASLLLASAGNIRRRSYIQPSSCVESALSLRESPRPHLLCIHLKVVQSGYCLLTHYSGLLY